MWPKWSDGENGRIAYLRRRIHINLYYTYLPTSVKNDPKREPIEFFEGQCAIGSRKAPVPEREPKSAPVLELASCRFGGQHIHNSKFGDFIRVIVGEFVERER